MRIFRFNVTSKNLAHDMIKILEKFGFHPKMCIQNREKYGWKELYLVRLRVVESIKLELFLNKILKELNLSHTFKKLKYEKSEPGEI